MRVTILGCGGASGVPLIGGTWGNCDPLESRNRRRRSSILVERGATTLLVDTGPDLRAQLLDAGVKRLDAILYTHIHADHTHGIDEIRALNRAQRQAIEAFGTQGDLAFLINKFDYIFDEPGRFNDSVAFYKPSLVPREFVWGQAFDCHGIPVLPFAQDHGFIPSTGLRFGDIAYSTDLVRLDDAGFDALKGVKVWIVACLQEVEHPTHAHLDRVLGWIERVGPERAVLTHLSHRLDYSALSARCPAGVVVAYDGMVIEVADDEDGAGFGGVSGAVARIAGGAV
jgi:phosphoribosyl 1,2-cyclic phosphate phosphodiesterase